MSRLIAVDPSKASGKAKDLLDTVKEKIGMTPNMMRTMANSTAVLEGYLNLNSALSGGALSAKLREQIAIAIADLNSCEYCLSAHTAIGKMVGLNGDEIESSRLLTSSDPKIEAALRFAQQIVENHGGVTEEEVNRVREAGYTDGEIAEIIANVALNIFTNYFNKVAQTEVDFPKVPLH